MTGSDVFTPARALWWQLPLVSVLAVLGLVTAGPEPRMLPILYLAIVTPVLCATDVLRRRLPNRLVLPGYLVAAAGVLGQWWLTGELPVVALVSGSAYFAFLLVLGLAGGMGMGDVKLAGVLGTAAGLIGGVTAVITPSAAFVLGGIAAVVALRQGRGSGIPFGPFMLAGFWIAVALA